MYGKGVEKAYIALARSVLKEHEKGIKMKYKEQEVERYNGGIRLKDTSKDQVKAPIHYADRKYQSILVMEDSMSTEAFKGYLKGNVMKYISRAGKKDKTSQDLNKAATYLQWLIEVEETGCLINVPSFGGK